MFVCMYVCVGRCKEKWKENDGAYRRMVDTDRRERHIDTYIHTYIHTYIQYLPTRRGGRHFGFLGSGR